MLYESPHNVFWTRGVDGSVLVTKMVGDKDVGNHWQMLSQHRYTAEEWGKIVAALEPPGEDGPAYPPAHVEPEPVVVGPERAPKPPASSSATGSGGSGRAPRRVGA